MSGPRYADAGLRGVTIVCRRRLSAAAKTYHLPGDDTVHSLKSLLAGLLLGIVCGDASADQHGGVVPGAMAIKGKVSQWSVPTPLTARDPIPDGDGRIYFAVAGGDKIGRFDPGSGLFREWALPAGTKPHGLAITPDGKVFFAGYGNGALGELDTGTGTVRSYPTSSVGSQPYSLALDAAGNVWATERAAGRLAKLDRTGGTISEYPMDGEPYALAFDRRGLLWVTRMAIDTLSGFDTKTGKTTNLFTGTGSKPRRIGVAPDGMLWVSLYGTGKLLKVDPVLNSIVKEYQLPDGPNAGPYSVNADAGGRIWVTEFQTDSVAILDTKSEKFHTIRLPDKKSGVRNASIDGRGRYWYVCTTTGKLGVIE